MLKIIKYEFLFKNIKTLKKSLKKSENEIFNFLDKIKKLKL
jgi:hypothetical protein